MIPLNGEEGASLPIVETLTGRGFITGKSGAGKSNTASVIAEELLDRGYPILIVDTDGEYWGLKEQYEILHVGADEECDLQVGSEHASKLADLALTSNIPIILDVSGYLDQEDANRLVKETARHLFQKEKKQQKPFLLFVEEIHEYVPEGGGLDDVGRMLVRIAKRGRKRGLGLVGMSQRPADVKKDFITQCDWIAWHRLTWENDTNVVKRVLGKEEAAQVQTLEDGEALLMADFQDEHVRTVQVRRKRTFDAGATPDLEDYERPSLKSVSSDLVKELETISQREREKQDEVAILEDRVETLEEEKQALENELESARDMRDLAQQMAEGLQATGGSGATEKVNQLVEDRNQLRSSLEQEQEKTQALFDKVEGLEEELGKRPDISERAGEAVQVLAEEFHITGGDGSLRRKLKKARERIEELEREPRSKDLDYDPLENRDAKRLIREVENRLDGFNETRLLMLRAYILRGPVRISEAYKYTGNSPSSSWKSQVNQELVDTGLIRETEHDVYDYQPRKHVDEVLGSHFSDEEREAVVEAIEDRVDTALEEVTP